jgi:hypothetical protein
MKHLVKKSLAVSSAVAPLAHGLIVPTDVNITIGQTERLFIDFSTGETSTMSGSVTSQDASLGFDSNSEKPELSFINTDYVAASSGGTQYVARYNFGETLDFLNNTSITSPHFEFAGIGPWKDDTAGNVGYAALQNTATSKEMWLAIDYDDTANTLKLISFAFANNTDNVTAGQVPEPAETGALMALAAGSVALYRSRKKRLAHKKSA